jgi:hypothetical protein
MRRSLCFEAKKNNHSMEEETASFCMYAIPYHICECNFVSKVMICTNSRHHVKARKTAESL